MYGTRNVKINHKKFVPLPAEFIEEMFYVVGLKRWNVAVEFATVCYNGTHVITIMCFSEQQLHTSYVLNNDRDVDILRINISFLAIKLTGEFPEQSTSSRYCLFYGSRTFMLITVGTDV
jgi:hypothetical protein